MPEVDTSIYRTYAPAHPLDTLAKMQALKQSQLGLERGGLENRMLGANVSQTEAQREAARKSIDPATGRPNMEIYMSELALGGASPEALLQGQQQRTAQISEVMLRAQAEREKLGLSKDQWNIVGNSMLPLISMSSQIDPATGQPRTLTREDVMASIRTNVQGSAAASDPNFLNRVGAFLADLPADPGELQQRIGAVALMADPTAERVNQLFGTPQNMDVGSTIQTRRIPTLTGRPEIMAVTEKELTPEGMSEMVEVVGADGTKYKVPKGALLGGSVSGASGGGTGRYPGIPGAPVGAVAVSELAPGVAEAAKVSGTESASVYQRDITEAGGYAQRIQGLNKARENLDRAFTGPGAGSWQTFASVLDTFGLKPPTDVDSYAQAQKYMQDYANARGAALGMGTDQARSMVNAANPGVQTPKGAALAVLDVQRGLERMQAAQVAAAQREGVTPQDYNAWRARWNLSVDPSAFAPPKLDRAGWAAKKSAMGDKWPAYQRGLDAAVEAGVISASDLLK